MEKRKAKSFYSRTAGILVGLAALQVVIILSTLFLGNGLRIANEATRDSFENINSYRSTIVQSKLGQYQNIESNHTRISEISDSYFLTHRISVNDLMVNRDTSLDFTKQMVPELINMLRNSKATGSFLFLDNNSEQDYFFTHIKDLNPETNPTDNSDLFLEIGLPSIIENEEITGGSGRKNFLNRITENDEFFSYYDQIKNLEDTEEKIRFWTDNIRLEERLEQTMLYAIPLYNDGQLFGLCGISIDMNVFITQVLNYREIQNDGLGSYLLTRKVDDLHYKVIAHDGAYIESFLPNDAIIEIANNRIKTSNNKAAYTLQPLHLYQNNALFYQDYALIAVTQSNRLSGASNQIIQSLLIGSIISLAIIILFSIIIARFIANPLQHLTKEVSKMDGTNTKLSYVHIQEIDALTDSINFFSAQIGQAAVKLENIIELSGFEFGAYEYIVGDNKVYITNSMRQFLKIPNTDISSGNYLSIDIIGPYFNAFRQNHYKDEKYMFVVQIDGESHIIKVNNFDQKEKYLGVFVDVTDNIKEIDSVLYERDHDMLTNIYNRRAFSDRANELLLQKTMGVFIMLDIDGLKNVNDFHGHMIGDLYIKFITNRIKSLPFFHDNILFGRASGDEFYIYVHGFSSKSENLKAIQAINDAVNSRTGFIDLTPNIRIKGGASIGYAWYPDDATQYETLIRFADFAMYRAKKSSKGKTAPFNTDDFTEYLKSLDTSRALESLIVNQAIFFCFQPIVNAHTGETFGFEALMRTNMPEFGGPLDILKEAEKTGKKNAIEYLTFFNSMNAFIERKGFNSYKLFINSISDTNLTKKEYDNFVKLYKDYLSNIVIEILEESDIIKNKNKDKWNFINGNKLLTALDDFGSGYNNNIVLLKTNPNFIKVDQSTIKGIATNTNQQKILKSIILILRHENQFIIAEGIENYDDLAFCISCGVDFVQGYYIGRPKEDLQPIATKIRGEIVYLNKKPII